MITTLQQPPAFDAKEWRFQPQAPADYTGTKFDFNLVAELIQVVNDDTVRILGTEIRAVNILTTAPPQDPNHPIYFEPMGLVRMLLVSIWADRLTVEVCRLGSSKVLSTSFPETEAQLRQALQDIVDSCA